MLHRGFFLLLTVLQAYAAGSPGRSPGAEPGIGTLHVRFTGVASDRGTVAAVLFDSRQAYEDKKDPVRASYLAIKDRQAAWSVEDLPYGEFAIMTYHDENNNERLDSNLLRIPKERYGFSNNARGRFGPPDFEEVRVVLDQPTLTLEIELH